MTQSQAEPKPVASDFEETIRFANSQRERIREVARQAADRHLSSIWFVGCGGSHYAQSAAHYTLTQRSRRLTSYRLNSNEFNHAQPAHLGLDSLVVVGSHSGKTPETLQAIETARAAGAPIIVGMTRSLESPLAESVGASAAFTYESGDTVWEPKQTYFGLLAHELLSAYGDETAQETETAAAGYLALPDALRRAIEQQDEASHEIAVSLAGEPITYLLGAGPSEDIARCLAMCYLQEMQWMNAAAFNAGEFFHGAFEVVTENTPVILLLGEDTSRPIAERAARFIKKYSKKSYLIDSADLELPGVPAAARAEVAPIALGTLVSRLAQHYEAVSGHSLDIRRYMTKVEY
ncbi:MAG: SIS domain-containing protein [Acidimicrobiales bacterium]